MVECALQVLSGERGEWRWGEGRELILSFLTGVVKPSCRQYCSACIIILNLDINNPYIPIPTTHTIQVLSTTAYSIIENRNRMSDRDALQWHRINYQERHALPLERWGHRLLQVSPRQLLLFGGFGGEGSEGRYLGDLWEYDIQESKWRQFLTSGDHPQHRSNYTIHYNEQDQQVILFGGGSSSKFRFNSVSILHLPTRKWERVLPDPSEESPWERTYHCSEFHYPYLIVHGGEGVSNLDLDDTWAFNTITRRWKRLTFEGRIPTARRFHSSVMIDSHLYIMGGCRDNYELLGDLFRTDLGALLEEGRTEGLRWECLAEDNRLGRWGQSSCVHKGKIYIFAGRINCTTDINDVLVIDPSTKAIAKLKVKEKSAPSARRRHAALVVGNCLLVFGGYNGKYLNDFSYINLPSDPSPQHRVNTVSACTGQEFSTKLRNYEKKISCDWSFSLQHKQGYAKIQTNRKLLLQNPFLACMLKYSQDGNLFFNLPDFCTLQMFRTLHLFLIENDAIFCKANSIDYYVDLLKAAEYFNCDRLIPAIEEYLIASMNTENFKQLLALAVQCSLPLLQSKAAEKCLRSIENDLAQENMTSNHLLCNEEEDKQVLKARIEAILSHTRQSLKFELTQARLRDNSRSFLTRTAQTLKKIFSPFPIEDMPSQKALPSKAVQKSGCFSKLMAFFSQIGKE